MATGTPSASQLGDDRLDQGLGVLRPGRGDPRRAPALGRVAVQRELADDEHLAAGLEHRPVHHAGVVVEHPQVRELAGQLRRLRGAVVVGDADEGEQPGADLADASARRPRPPPGSPAARPTCIGADGTAYGSGDAGGRAVAVPGEVDAGCRGRVHRPSTPRAPTATASWGVVDPAAGRVLSAKRWPALLLASATRRRCDRHGHRHPPRRPRPRGRRPRHRRGPVRLARPPGRAAPGAGGDALPFEMHTDPTDDASDVFEFPGPPGRLGRPGARPTSLTTASLRAAAALHPDGAWDVRRFRPLALLDVEGDGFVEDGWIGAAVRLGGVTIEPFMPTVPVLDDRPGPSPVCRATSTSPGRSATTTASTSASTATSPAPASSPSAIRSPSARPADLRVTASTPRVSGGLTARSGSVGGWYLMHPDDRPLRLAYLAYRGKPHVGGQGVYTRHLTKALVDLGHHVEVFGGNPYPVLDERVPLHELQSLDIYNDHFPMRMPGIWELKHWTDFVEVTSFSLGQFPEPLAFSLRAWDQLRHRVGDFDLVHDNQCLGYGLLGIQRDFPLLATIHHPITVDRRLEMEHAAQPLPAPHPAPLVLVHEHAVAGRPQVGRVVTVSENSFADIARDHGVAPARMAIVPVGVDPDLFRPIPGVERIPGRLITTASADVTMKGLSYLLEALAKLRTERDVTLVVIGKPKAGGASAEAIDRLGLERLRRVRLRRDRRAHLRALQRGRAGGRAVAVRGLLAAGHRGDVVRRAARGHHRRRPARGRRRRQRDRPAGPARRRRGPGRADRHGPRRPRAAGPHRRRRPPAGDRQLVVAPHRRAHRRAVPGPARRGPPPPGSG